MISTLAIVSGLAKSSGGPSVGIPALCEALSHVDVCRILLTGKRIQAGEQIFPNPKLVETFIVPDLDVNFFGFVLSPMFKEMAERICQTRNIKILHNHGAWQYANHVAAQTARKFKIPFVITPHGMLTLWCYHNKPWKKIPAWLAYQKNDLNLARAVHITSKEEGDDLRVLGYKGPLALIPNGVNVPEYKKVEKRLNGKRTALFVSRIHPKKGLLLLIKAWAQVKPKGWRMRLVGPNENGYLSVIQKAIRDNGLEQDFVYDEPVYGEAKWDLYREADLFILPTISENFGIVVPEALACGVPVITTHGAPWTELTEQNCGWWVPVNADSIAKALQEAVKLTDAERIEMGLKGRRLVEEHYTWVSIALKMKALYEWILGGGNPPYFVRLD